MKKEMLLNEIKELLLNDMDTLRDVVRELDGWNGCLDYLNIYNNDEEFFDIFFANNRSNRLTLLLHPLKCPYHLIIIL